MFGSVQIRSIVFLIMLFSVVLEIAFAGEKIQKPFLWEVKKDGRVSYILGVVHIGISAGELPSLVHEKIRDSEAFISEFDPSPVEKLYMQFHQMNLVGPRVSEMLAPETYEKLVRLIKKIHGEERANEILNSMDMLEPYFVLMQIRLLQMQLDKVDVAVSMDAQLQEYAMSLEKKVEDLESVFDGLGVVEKLGVKELEDAVNVMVEMEAEAEKKERADDKSRGVFEQKVAESYRNGDLEGVVKSFESMENPATKESREKSLLTRNENWIPVIQKAHDKNQGVFFAVGVSHLLGDRGVLKLLEEKGFEVRRVEVSDEIPLM